MKKLLRNHNQGALGSMEETIDLQYESLIPPSIRLPKLRCRHRTANGLIIYFILLISLLSITSASTSTGQDCTPIFIGAQHGVPNNTIPCVVPLTAVKVLEDSSFKLSCQLSQHHNFEWRINKSSELLNDRGTFTVNNTGPINGIVTTELLVRKVNQIHSGDYTCVLSGCQIQGQSPHHGLSIKVYAQKPRILSTEHTEVIGESGKDINITCVIEENDVSSEYIWQKQIMDGSSEEGRSGWYNMEDICKEVKKGGWKCSITRTIENETTNLTLSIIKLRKNDFGYYSCGSPIVNFKAENQNVEYPNNDVIYLRVTTIVRSKRAVERYEGLTSKPPAYFNNSAGKDEKVQVTKIFERGTNSTIGWEGNPAILFCNLTRGDREPTRYRVIWRLKSDGQYVISDLEKHLPVSDYYNYTESVNVTTLIINTLNITDRGWYQCGLWDSFSCKPFNAATPGCIVATYEIRLRVNQTFNQWYPLIAICAEVVLLFIIILIYEKRKSKIEVEESDTDGSPDQKNVSDNNGEGISEATRLAKD